MAVTIDNQLGGLNALEIFTIAFFEVVRQVDCFPASKVGEFEILLSRLKLIESLLRCLQARLQIAGRQRRNGPLQIVKELFALPAASNKRSIFEFLPISVKSLSPIDGALEIWNVNEIGEIRQADETRPAQVLDPELFSSVFTLMT